MGVGCSNHLARTNRTSDSRETGVAFLFSVITTILALFLVGFIKAIIVHKNYFLHGLETVLVGSLAATVAYLVGFLLKGLA